MLQIFSIILDIDDDSVPPITRKSFQVQQRSFRKWRSLAEMGKSDGKSEEQCSGQFHHELEAGGRRVVVVFFLSAAAGRDLEEERESEAVKIRRIRQKPEKRE